MNEQANELATMNKQENELATMNKQEIEQKNAREIKLCLEATNIMTEVIELFQPNEEDDEERAECCIDYVDDSTQHYADGVHKLDELCEII
jgi:hypothetical protein